MTTDFKAALAAAKLPEASIAVCLRGDLAAEIEVLERELAVLDRPATSLADGGRKREVAERIQALRAEMTAASVEFRLRAVSRRRWTELLGEHAPREGNDKDRVLGVNEDTFFDALLRECTADPVLTDEEWTHLLDEALTSLQYDQLTTAAWNLNRRGVDVPFSHAASRILSTSDSE